MKYGERVRFGGSYFSRFKAGKTKKVSISLAEDDWKVIEACIAAKEFRSMSDYFRDAHYFFKKLEK